MNSVDLCSECSSLNSTFSCSECQTLFCSSECFSNSKSHQRICESRSRIKNCLAFKKRITYDAISLSQRLLEYSELLTASSFTTHLMLSPNEFKTNPDVQRMTTTLEYWGLTAGVYAEWEDWYFFKMM